MNAAISSWVAHATREPGQLLASAMQEWIDAAPAPGEPLAGCPWLTSELHRTLLIHVDRAAHKRRHVPAFVCRTSCGSPHHGLSPFSQLVRDDTYGGQPLQIVHSAGVSALGHAIGMVRNHDASLAVAALPESDFEDPDFFDDHRAALISPTRDGVVLAVIHADVPKKENADDEAAREDLLRACGYSMYMFDLRPHEEPQALHRRFALLMEDVFDEITQIKADAAARILMSDPLWPAIVLRTGPEWRAAHAQAHADSLVTSP